MIYIFYLFCTCGQPTNESKTLPNDVTKREIERDLTGVLSVINASCPIDIDQSTITDSLTYDRIRNIIVYHNTILLELSVHDSSVKVFRSFSTNQLPIDYETGAGYAPFRELGIGIEHRVRDIRGNDLFSVTVP